MKTNIILAIRNILKNRTNSIITVTGIAVAIACCLIIYFYVNQEYSYNKFHENANNIFRINYNAKYTDFSGDDVRVEPEIADILKDEVPGIEKSTEYRYAFEQVLKHENDYFDMEMGYADKDFLDIFSFDLIAGDKEKIFINPDEIVITKQFADIILKDNHNYTSLLGKAVEFPLAYDNQQFTITGILENIPRNSSIQFQGIIPGENGMNFGGCDNDFGYTSVFYLLEENASRINTENNVISVVEKYYSERVNRNQNLNILKKSDDAFSPFILSLNDVYLEDRIGNCFESTNNKRNAIILIAIGLLILIIACSNYIILSLGQYLKKTGEVGIRKAVGARKHNIFTVFFSEGLVLTLLAFILGSVLCLGLLPIFNNLSQVEIYTELINIPRVVLFVLLSFLGIVFFTSVVPVFVFSNVSPNLMSGKKISIGKSSFVSQIFVSVQYSLSIILIIVTVFIVRQSNHLKNKSLGLTTENIVDVYISKIDNDKRFLFRDLVKEHPGVINLTLTSRNFVNGSSNSHVDNEKGERISVYRFKVDNNYIPTLGLNLTHGNNFTVNNVKSGDRSIVVNNKFVEAFEIKDDPIGKTYNINGVDYSIKGVVDDYHFFDATRRIEPAMLFTRLNSGNGFYRALIKFQPEQLSDLIKHIEKCYKQVAPGTALEYQFWDERLGQRYEDEERWSKITGYAAIIAILISTLGLFGLTILLVNQRIKEIGVRKVNGARSRDVLVTINRSFAIWLLGSLIVAAPIAYYVVEQWIQNFPFKVDVSWWVFAICGIIALVVALSTVSFQSWRVASRNPVEALRYE